MSTRNPKNKRSLQMQRGEAPGGATRKGASRAKPARQSASSVHVVEVRSHKDPATMTKEERREDKRQKRFERDRLAAASNILMSQNELYRHRRVVWWALLGAGIACTVLAWIFFATLQGVSGLPGLIALIGAYAFIIGGFVWDWFRIRPIRKESDEMVAHFTPKRLQQIIDDDYEANEAKKAAKAAKRAAKVEARRGDSTETNKVSKVEKSS